MSIWYLAKKFHVGNKRQMINFKRKNDAKEFKQTKIKF